MAGGRETQVAAVTVEWETEVGVVWLAEWMIHLEHHGQVETVSGGHHGHVGPGELVSLVDGVGVPL